MRQSFRIDHRLSDKHNAEIIYHLVRFDTDQDTLNGFEPRFPGIKGGFQNSWRSTGSFGVRSVLSPTKINEARFGFQRAPVIFGSDLDTFDVGGQRYFISFPTIENPQLIFVTSGRNTSNFQYLDNFSWIKGTHTLRFGGDHRSIVSNQIASTTGIVPTISVGVSTANPSPLPAAAFPNSTTTTRTLAQNVYAILIGQIAGISQTFNVETPESGFRPGLPLKNRIRERYFGFYFTDSWRARRNLTLNYGIRYEYMTVPDQLNRLALQPRGGEQGIWGQSGVGNIFKPGVLQGTETILELAGSSNGKKFYNEDFNNFSPSFGLAWSPSYNDGILGKLFGDGKTSIRGGYSVSYSLESASVFTNALGNNAGLSSTVSLTTAAQGIRATSLGQIGTSFRAGFPIPQTPQFVVPIPQSLNFTNNRGNGVFGFAQNLRTPYVQTWSFGIEREVMRDTVFEIRYVGNLGVKLWRGIDINEVNIFENGFLQEFLNAQRNLVINRANNLSGFGFRGLPGQSPLPIFNALFGTDNPANANFSNSNFITRLDQNEPGELANQMFINFLNGLTRGSSLPINFFMTNPLAAFADIIVNGSTSNYHSMQIEFRRRLSRGLFFQANYTFSRALTDFEGSGSNFSAFITLRNPRYEYRRASFDTNHRLNANFVWELPFGPGRRFLNQSSVLSNIIGGWQVNGILIAYTGQPLTITSGRGTVNRAGRSGSNTVDLIGMTVEQLRDKVRIVREANGVFYFTSDLRQGTGGRATETIFANPQAGKLGSLGFGILSVPSRWNFDFSLIKRVKVTESKNVEFRAEFFNAFNNPQFTGPNTSINSTTFGAITGTFDPRIMQFAMRFNF